MAASSLTCKPALDPSGYLPVQHSSLLKEKQCQVAIFTPVEEISLWQTTTHFRSGQVLQSKAVTADCSLVGSRAHRHIKVLVPAAAMFWLPMAAAVAREPSHTGKDIQGGEFEETSTVNKWLASANLTSGAVA
ncbi:hypothetical protein CRENBAI_005428 [Crenichthys baileyi]|uniref:Uncharacterized protein n=1 Tax=Crenichthys baileyi TaxID=28760 RepID=A0AAV9QQY3_9TELE